MARLSSAPTNTPKSERKSSRLREIFKHRPSNSASTSPVTTLNPPQEDSSPVLSPTVKPGFQKIGLLPSERSMTNLGDLEDQTLSGTEGKSAAEFIRDDDMALQGVSVPHCLDTSLDISGATHADEVSKKVIEDQKMKKKISLQQSFDDAMLKHQGESKGDKVNAAEYSSSPLHASTTLDKSAHECNGLPLGSSHNIAEAMHGLFRTPTNSRGSTDIIKDMVSSASAKQKSSPTSDTFYVDETDSEYDADAKNSIDKCKDVSIKHTNDFLKSEQESGRLRHDATLMDVDHVFGSTKQANRFEQAYGDSSAVPGSTHINVIDNNGNFKFPPANISHGGFPLGQSTREYIDNEVALALKGHTRATPDGPAHVTFHINLPDLVAPTRSTPRVAAKPVLFQGPKTIGPFTINHPRAAQDLQIGIITVYSIVLLSAALMGPKSLLLTLWRIAVILALYIGTSLSLEWSGDMVQDVLIAPVVYAIAEVKDVGMSIVSNVGGVLAGALQNSVKGGDVQNKDK